MKLFSLAVLCRRIGGGELVINPVCVTVIFHGFGNKFAIVGDEDAKSVARLYGNRFVPRLES